MNFVCRIVCLGAIAVLTSCGFDPGGSIIQPAPPVTYHPPKELIQPRSEDDMVNYIPYIEEVIVPDNVYQGEPFQIVIRISAEFRPAVLRGYPFWHQQPSDPEGEWRCDEFYIWEIPPEAGYTASWEIYIPVTLTNPPGVGEPIDRFVFELPGLEVGEYLVTTSSTTERRLGGIGGIHWCECGYVEGDPEFLDSSGVKSVQFEINVLPIEDTSAQE